MRISFTLPSGDDADDADIVKNVGQYFWEVEIFNEYSVRVKVNPLARFIDVDLKLKELQDLGFYATVHPDF